MLQFMLVTIGVMFGALGFISRKPSDITGYIIAAVICFVLVFVGVLK